MNNSECVRFENEDNQILEINYFNDTLSEIEDLNARVSDSTIDLI